METKETNPVVEKIPFKMVGFVTRPELVKVLTIKEKYVEQMREVKETSHGDKILGVSRHVWIILVRPNGMMVRLNRLDRVTELMGPNNDRTSDEANHIIDQYPQLFAD